VRDSEKRRGPFAATAVATARSIVGQGGDERVCSGDVLVWGPDAFRVSSYPPWPLDSVVRSSVCCQRMQSKEMVDGDRQRAEPSSGGVVDRVCGGAGRRGGGQRRADRELRRLRDKSDNAHGADARATRSASSLVSGVSPCPFSMTSAPPNSASRNG